MLKATAGGRLKEHGRVVGVAVAAAVVIVAAALGVESLLDTSGTSHNEVETLQPQAVASQGTVDTDTTAKPASLPPEPISTSPAQDNPSSWATTVSNAEAIAAFRVYVPGSGGGEGVTSAVSPSNMIATYAQPGGGTVVFAYNTPSQEAAASAGISQGYLSITEHPWRDGDPQTLINQRLSIVPGSSSCTVGTTPALCVSARAPEAIGQNNPADVLLDLNNTSVELTGGDAVQTLKDIAANLIPTSNAPSSPASSN
jgi:hypothetical protein